MQPLSWADATSSHHPYTAKTSSYEAVKRNDFSYPHASACLVANCTTRIAFDYRPDELQHAGVCPWWQFSFLFSRDAANEITQQSPFPCCMHFKRHIYLPYQSPSSPTYGFPPVCKPFALWRSDMHWRVKSRDIAPSSHVLPARQLSARWRERAVRHSDEADAASELFAAFAEKVTWASS
jgi:hypothetical protein